MFKDLACRRGSGKRRKVDKFGKNYSSGTKQVIFPIDLRLWFLLLRYHDHIVSYSLLQRYRGPSRLRHWHLSKRATVFARRWQFLLFFACSMPCSSLKRCPESSPLLSSNNINTLRTYSGPPEIFRRWDIYIALSLHWLLSAISDRPPDCSRTFAPHIA